MEHKRLGITGVMVPEIGLGVWRYSGGPGPLRHGIDLGAFLVDTAEVSRTEDVVGEAVAGIREDVFIATKVAGDNLRHDDVLRAADRSLRELKTDRIDLYQLHSPNDSVPPGLRRICAGFVLSRRTSSSGDSSFFRTRSSTTGTAVSNPIRP